MERRIKSFKRLHCILECRHVAKVADINLIIYCVSYYINNVDPPEPGRASVTGTLCFTAFVDANGVSPEGGVLGNEPTQEWEDLK